MSSLNIMPLRKSVQVMVRALMMAGFNASGAYFNFAKDLILRKLSMWNHYSFSKKATLKMCCLSIRNLKVPTKFQTNSVAIGILEIHELWQIF